MCLQARIEGQLEILGEDLHELRRERVPLPQHLIGALAPGVLKVATDQPLNDFLVLVRKRLKFDSGVVDACRELTIEIEHVGKAAAHPRPEISARVTQDHYVTSGHVLAGVIPHAFDDGVRTAVAHSKALPGKSVEVGLDSGRAVEDDIPSDDILRRLKFRPLWNADDDLSTRKALSAVVVGVSGDE